MIIVKDGRTMLRVVVLVASPGNKFFGSAAHLISALISQDALHCNVVLICHMYHHPQWYQFIKPVHYDLC